MIDETDGTQGIDRPPMPPSIRVADSDRDVTAERLRAAVADGRLEFSELDERLEATYAAKTQAELDAVTADLPVPRTAPTGPLRLQTRSGSLVKNGHWAVPSEIVAECTSGKITLDFTEAHCPHAEVMVRATAASGTVLLIVPIGWAVALDEVSSTSGSVVSTVRTRAEPGMTVVHVSGRVRSGRIRARYPRRNFWHWLLRRQPEV